MKLSWKKTKTYYRYAALYFISLFVISALIMSVILYSSADGLEKLEIQNTKNSMQETSDLLEKQIQTMQSIALQIGLQIDYRPYRVEQGGIYDINLLEKFKQYTNYSPLTSHYFLVYQSVQKIYTSSGNTSYFDFYAPEKLEIPYELTGEALRRIVSADAPCLELYGESILAVFPVRFSGYSGNSAHATALCFVLTKSQLKNYIQQLTAGMPNRYDIAVDGTPVLQVGNENTNQDFARKNHKPLQVFSSGGRIAVSTPYDFSGWRLLIARNGWIVGLGIGLCLLLAVITALTMAHFSLRPLERLIEKYAGGPRGIESEFQQLDSILGSLTQSNSDTMYQLRNHLLIMMLRGNYSDKLLHRWSMLGISFQHPYCGVCLVEHAAASPLRKEIREKLEALTDKAWNVYTAEMEENDQLIVIANYSQMEAWDNLVQAIRKITALYNCLVYVGHPVESGKRLPISYISALTEYHTGPANVKNNALSAEVQAKRLIDASTSENADVEKQLMEETLAYLSEEPLNGVMTRHRVYDLTSNVLKTAEEKGMRIDRAAVNALVMLPDPAMAAHDLMLLLKKAAPGIEPEKVSGDDTARAIVEYVIANAYDPDLDLQAMSAQFGLSADYISSMIKRETGYAFKEYVTQLRISEAQRLLHDDKSLTVNEVAALVGYRKASNFSKKFKDLTGILPSQMK